MSDAAATGLLLLELQPATLDDGDRLEQGLRLLAAEDPILTVQADRSTGTVTIGTIGELQLEIVVDRLKREFHVEASVSKPRVAYRERNTPTGPVRLEPLMRVDVSMPLEFAADVVQEVIARGGRLESQQVLDNWQTIRALVPLAQLFGFDCDLRQRTRGRCAFSQQFDSFQPVGGDRGSTADDRGAPVGAPLKPVPPRRPSAIALPEPEDMEPKT